MESKAKMETLREIWNGMDRSHYEVGPDRDGLSCVEVRWFDTTGKLVERLVFSPDIAKLIAKAINLCANELEPDGNKR